MGRSASKKTQADMLTTNFSYRILVGEKILHFFLVKDLLIETEPAREKGQPFYLGDVTAGVNNLAVSVGAKDMVSVRGDIGGKAMFYSSAGQKEVAWQEEEFTKEMDFPGALPGMAVNGHGRISFIEDGGPPLETEGKLLYQLKIEVEVHLSVSDHRQFDIAVGLKDISPEKINREVISFEELVGEQAISATVNNEVEFAEQPEYIKSVSGHLQDLSWDLGKEDITIKGELVTVFYFSSGGERGFKSKKQQFNQQVPFPGIDEDYRINLFPRVVCTVNEILGKNVRQTTHIDIFLRVTNMVQQEIITDIEGINVKREYLMLCRPLGMVKESLEMVQKLFFSYPQQIAAGPCRLLHLNIEPHDGTIAVNGTLEKNIYYIPPAKTETADYSGYEKEAEKEILPTISRAEEDFYSTLYLPGVEAESHTAANFIYNSADFAPTETDTLQISHALLEVKAWNMQEIPVVVPHRVAPGTSFVVYTVKSEDTLLKIGRNYGVKPSAIAEENGLEEDALLEAGQKLLITLL